MKIEEWRGWGRPFRVWTWHKSGFHFCHVRDIGHKDGYIDLLIHRNGDLFFASLYASTYHKQQQIGHVAIEDAANDALGMLEEYLKGERP